jgi:hypothetical protein
MDQILSRMIFQAGHKERQDKSRQDIRICGKQAGWAHRQAGHTGAGGTHRQAGHTGKEDA